MWVIYAYYFLVTDFPAWLNFIENKTAQNTN
jgi:hypothetical protein